MTISSAWLNKHADRLHREFNLNGFVSLPGFLDSEGVPALRSELDRYIRDVVPTITGNDVYYEDKDDPSTLKQLKEMNQYDAYFKQLFMDSRFRSLAAILLGEAVRPTNFQYFNKPAGAGPPSFSQAGCQFRQSIVGLVHIPIKRQQPGQLSLVGRRRNIRHIY